MASPSPMAVVRFSEKIETCVNIRSICRIRSVPTIDTTPMASGSPAAMTLPKTRISRSIVIGMAIDSARARSVRICVLICRNTSARPPTVTVSWPSVRENRGDSFVTTSWT